MPLTPVRIVQLDVSFTEIFVFLFKVELALVVLSLPFAIIAALLLS